MASGERIASTWAAYIKVVRDEVREGTGVFGIDQDLLALFEECFDRGDDITGDVRWSVESPTAPEKCRQTYENVRRCCTVASAICELVSLNKELTSERNVRIASDVAFNSRPIKNLKH